MTQASDYLFDNAAEEAGRRFRSLGEVFDPVTFRHFEAIGIEDGWRCWEVGAGGPSVATWLADRVGDAGDVLATDLDTRWLQDAARPNLAIRTHDITDDQLPDSEGFDLVHARLVLVHLEGRHRALAAMARAVRPGGWLVIEDFDMELQPAACLDENAPYAHLAQKMVDGLNHLLVDRGADRCYGRKLPRLVREHGFTPVIADAYYPVAHAGALELMVANIRQVRDGLIAGGHATEEEIDRYLALAEDRLIDLTTPPLISAAGRKPMTAA